MRSGILCAIAIALLLTGCGGPGVLTPRPTGAVTGHVTVRGCGGANESGDAPSCRAEPVAGATLTFQSNTSSTSSTVTTDSEGAYRVDLAAGTYSVTLNGAGNSFHLAGPRQVTVTAGKTVTADYSYVIHLL